ncbi:hypothetical protein ACIB24_19020 [Spongisporangium articulatum]|uniref:Uncharacterized protein n=1 Tax=Spongisporangium articulatum TaxID=3362603 RepID=A0ABW8AU86_9ACTN
MNDQGHPGAAVAVRLAVGLHPRPFRDRFGADLLAEARTDGWHAVPDVLRSLSIWLHPAVWPAASAAQRRLRVHLSATGLALLCGYLVACVQELDPAVPRRGAAAPVIGLATALLGVGTVVILPRPRDVRVLVRIGSAGVRRLIAPVFVAGVVVACANGVLPASGVPPRLLVVLWWMSLAAAAFQSCRTLAGTSPETCVPASSARLRVGLTVLAAGALLAGAVLTAASTVVPGLVLLALSAALAVDLHDTSTVPMHR